MVNIAFWNCCGALSEGFHRAIRYVRNHHKCDIIALSETRISGPQADYACARSKFSNNARVECVGFTGGIWLLSRSDRISLNICEKNANFIHAIVDINRVTNHIFAVYGPPTAPRRIPFWHDLERAIAVTQGPIILGGDFNYIINLGERRGGSGGLNSDSSSFIELIDQLSLVDLGFVGTDFTWSTGL
ncbi:hypothetical protein V2J09_000012 [Rumex salicifolius]